MNDMSKPAKSGESTAKVLLADDDEIARSIISDVLSAVLRVEFTMVPDGRQALVSALSQKFDLLIFDRNMDPIKGDRIIRCLRTGASPNRESPMILTTAELDHVREGSLHLAEASLYMPKPIDASGLIKWVSRSLALQ